MYPEIIISVLALLWSGMIVGISFFESWIKFRTPSLKREVGLDVGRTVFGAFQFAQIILLIILLIAGFISYFLPRYWPFLLIVTVIVLIQQFFLFPRLKRRVDLIMAGQKQLSTRDHAIYGLLEVLKLMALMSLGIMIILSFCSFE